MANPNEPQNWFCTVADEDLYHIHLLIVTGTLNEALTKLRSLTVYSRLEIKVHALEGSKVQPEADELFKDLVQVGTLLKEVARINRFRTFEVWRGSFSEVFKQLSPEQKQAELQALGARVLKEIEALKIQQQINPTPPTKEAIPVQEG